MIEKNRVTAKEKNTKTENHDLSAIFMICIGYLGYSVMDALSKWLIGEIPLAEITMIVNGITAALLLAVTIKTQGVEGLKTKHIKLHLIRISFFLGIPYFILKSLDILPLTQFYSVIFIAPIIIMALSIFMLKEKFEAEKVLMGIIGLIGVFIAVQADLIERLDGFIYCLLGMLFIVGNTVALRKMRNVSHPLLFALYPSIAMTVAYAPFAITNYVAPTLDQWLILIASGIAVFCGQIGCVTGYTRASSTSTVAPYHYTQIIWGALFGYFIFEHVPSTSTLIGMVLIIYSGLYILILQRKRGNVKA